MTHPIPDTYMTFNKYVQLLDSKSEPPFDEQTMSIIHNLVLAIDKAERGISKIDPSTEDGRDLLELEGMTGSRTRHLYNNISGHLENVKYLEVGTWNGSSSVSAVYKNKINALFIDNWSQFGGTSDKFKENMKKFNTESKCFLLESDCWKVDLSKIGTFNVYLYDGDHSEIDHFKALEYYLPVLQETFVYLVDDWNWPNVRDGTMRAIRELNLDVKFRHEIFVSSDDLLNMPNHKGRETWWNGCGIFILSKTPKTPKGNLS
jgi:hypothetical protein